MRIRGVGCLGLMAIVSLIMVVMGIMQVVEGARFTSAKTVTLEQFVKQHPTEGWFHITGGYLSIAEGAHMTRKKEYSTDAATSDRTKVYLPLRSTTKIDPKMDKLEAPIDVLVMTDSESVLNRYWNLQDMTDEALKNVTGDQLVVEKDMDGMVGSVLNSASSDDKAALEKGLKNLTPGYILFEDGAKPSKGTGFSMVIGGIVLGLVSLGLLVLMIARWRT